MSNGPGNYFYKSGAGGSGSGSGFGAINYITNFGAETDTTGWATYADAAGNIPVDGTGGSATNLTFSRSTSTPLIGTGQFSLVQANSTSLQGKGVGYAFTIDPGFQSTNLAIQFSYNASSTFVTGDGITAPLNDGTVTTNAGNSDIEIFIYDVTNAILIPVSPQIITGKGTQNYQFKGTFQTASNSTSYRLIFHVATASANATGWTFLFDNVFVGPQAQISGSIETDWNSFTPTGSWVANSTYTGFWRRIGGNMEVQVNIALAGAPTSAALTINMPTGYTIDTTRLVNSTANVGSFVGSASAKSAGSVSSLLVKYNNTSSVVVLYLTSITVAANITNVDATHPGVFANGDAVAVLISVPIVGWASTTTMSNDTDTRVVAMQVSQASPTATITGSLSLVKYTSGVTADTHGGFSTSTGAYTVPVAGYYRCSTSLNVAATFVSGQTVVVAIGKNSTTVATIAGNQTAGAAEGVISATVSGTILCVAGDTLSPLVSTGGSATSVSAIATSNFFHVERLSGPSAIAATDTVAAAYTDTAGSVIATTTGKYAYATKVFDTHSAYGNSGIYTVPISGKYLISGIIQSAGTTMLTTNLFELAAYKNGTKTLSNLIYGNGTAQVWGVNAMGLLSCVAGDTLAIQVRMTGTGSTAVTIAGDNYFSINRIGN